MTAKVKIRGQGFHIVAARSTKELTARETSGIREGSDRSKAHGPHA